MTPEKAKEILTMIANEPYSFYTQDDKEAILLAIRAIDLCLKYQLSEEFIHPYDE